MFTLKLLPYALEALAPHISARTLALHYGKHHQAYVDNLNKLIDGTDFEGMPLENIIRASAGKEEELAIYNNAGQVYDHDFFWSSLCPANERKEISSELLKLIERDFVSLDKLLEKFKEVALSQFGSGWVWLVLREGRLDIIKTGNGNPAFLLEVKPLLTLDVWEHSYYLDYENRRGEYIENVINNLFNWEFAALNLLS